MTAFIAKLRILRRSNNAPALTPIVKYFGFGLFLLFFVLVFCLYTRAGGSAHVVYAATSSQLNFQARLQNSAGGIVPDGSYSVQFKLYTVSAGGVAEWSETDNPVIVRNGYFNVYLGASTPFASTIDWSADHWLTMNVNGDGDMTPRIQLSSVPYAFRSAQADSLTNGSSSLTASNLAQLAPSSMQAVNSALTLLQLNQTGSGALIQLQHNGADTLTLAANGDLVSTGAGTFKGINSSGLVSISATATTALALTGAPTSSATSALLQIGNTILNGNNLANGGTYIGLNAPSSGPGSAADFLNFEASGISKLQITAAGNLVAAGTVQYANSTADSNTLVCQNSSGLLALCSTNVLGGLGFIQGGNTFSGSTAGDLGTNNNAPLNFRTNNSTKLTLSTSGDLIFAQASNITTSTGNLSLNTSPSTTSNTAAITIKSGDASIGTSLSAGTVTFDTGTSTAGGSGLINLGNTNATNIVIGNSSTVTSLVSNTLSAKGALSFNTNNNAATNINTGSSTGLITIGGGSAPLVISSTNFAVSSGGAISGITSYTQTSGNFAISGIGSFGTATGAVSLNGATTVTTATANATALTINGTTGTAATALVVSQTGDAANISLTNTARTNGALISLAQNTSAFTGTGLLLNFANGSGSFTSGSFLDFQVNGVSKFNVDNAGALTISSDDTSAILIQASGGLKLFNVDTTSNIVRVGSGVASSDNIGIIFVLDTKNTNGDPTGEEGAMYYNSARNSYRCYQGDRGWTDCIGAPKPNTRRTTRIDYAGTGTAFVGLGDVFTTAGNAPTAIAATTTTPGMLDFGVTVIGQTNGISGNLNYNSSSNPSWQSYVALPTTGSMRLWAGLTDQTVATMTGSANPAGNYAAFRYDTGAGDANWQCVTKDNVTQTIANSGVAVSTTGVKMEIVVADGKSVEFKINGAVVCTILTHLPSSNTMLRYVEGINRSAGTNRDIRLGWVYVESDL